MRTAILVDGAFYRRRAFSAFGEKTPDERANELMNYCWRHLRWHGQRTGQLYRIFYYDCPPLDTQVYHPLLKKSVPLSKTATAKWSVHFYKELAKKRKVALRMGELSGVSAKYLLKPNIQNKLFRGEINISDIKEDDFVFTAQQKGVDMRIGLDISTLALKGQVEQIVLISGDSDFVPAAKLARREGIDFILDPLFANIPQNLIEHIDGLRTCDPAFKPN